MVRETDVAGLMMDAIRMTEKQGGRSRQTAIGPSSIGGCRKRTWLQLQGTAPVQETIALPAFMGSAIHDRLVTGLRLMDPFGDRFLMEKRIAAPMPSGQIMAGRLDLFDRTSGLLIDWKTKTKKDLGWLTKNPPTLGAGAANWPDFDNVQQTMTYGWILTELGETVKQVAIVGIARDGNERHVRVDLRDYDPEIAAGALDWCADVYSRETAPDPEKGGTFCRDYCPFWSADGRLCSGLDE